MQFAVMLSRSWLKHYSPAELLRIIASLLVLQVDKPMQQLQLPDVQAWLEACNQVTPYDLVGGDVHGNLLPSLGEAATAVEA